MPRVDIRKLTVFYNYKGRGFSESYYSVGQIQDVKKQAPDLIKLRLAFADDDVQAVYGRISDMQAPRHTDFLDLEDTPGMTGKITEDGCSPTDVVLMRVRSAGSHQGPFYLHAFPAKFLKETKVVPDGKWFDKVKAWAELLGSRNSSWKALTSDQSVTVTSRPIVSATPKSPRGFLAVCEAVDLVSAGDVLLIQGASQDSVGYRGRKVVRRVSNTDKTILFGGVKPVGSIGDGATYTKLVYSAGAIEAIQPVRLAEHKVGKVFAVPVGRRPATLSLRR